RHGGCGHVERTGRQASLLMPEGPPGELEALEGPVAVGLIAIFGERLKIGQGDVLGPQEQRTVGSGDSLPGEIRLSIVAPLAARGLPNGAPVRSVLGPPVGTPRPAVQAVSHFHMFFLSSWSASARRRVAMNIFCSGEDFFSDRGHTSSCFRISGNV